MSQQEFTGNPRFHIRRRLGSGGFGVVYEAFDREHHVSVALKTLRHFDAAALYRFKQEFRSLTDVAHPNLITLYELLSEGDQWFFTMELIDGVPFNAYVRCVSSVAPMPASQGGPDAPTRTVMNASRSPEAAFRPPTAGTLDVDRLRHSLDQVAAAVCAIHEAGILHRDIKPSNVLVTPVGRAVLLDFGLVSELRPGELEGEALIAGTPGYMSPEQASGRPVTAATDWYSFGVMLYEALVGALPAVASTKALLAKARERVTPPVVLNPGVPADLNALCMDLLEPEPDARPTDRDVLRWLSRTAGEVRAARSSATRGRHIAPFIGRERHLAELTSASYATGEGRTVVVYVRGRSGMGKTALVQRFLDQARQATPSPVVLTGRCYERESVPFKALDSLVDALTRHLKSLPAAEIRAILPRDVRALARLFPVLREVDAVVSASPMPAIVDSQEVRRRAFAAFRALMSALSARRPLILFIDDLQWGDLDSGALLADVLRPPHPPSLLLVGAYRSEEVATSPFLRTIAPALVEAADARAVDVAELTPEEARRLALVMTGADDSDAAARAGTIAEESGGSPFFIEELVRYAAEGGGAVRLGQVIDARVSQLPADARHLLELVAIAGQPLDVSVAAAAATLEGDERQVLRLLHAKRLARTRGTDRPALEIYHDRIRETVTAHISRDRSRLYHGRLAEAWEASGRGDPEVVATHHQAAGRLDRAAQFAGAAARRAEEALAFDRAARLYRWVLELHEHRPAETQQLRTKLADALANAGRGDQAAYAYLAAATLAPANEAADLERRAAEQLLRMGNIDEGLDVLRTVLSRVGLKMASTPTAALLTILAHRALIRLRGLRFRERPASRIPPATLMKIDACWTAAVGLSMVDPIRGVDFQQRNLWLALRAGEPYRVARALAMQVANTSIAGGRRRLERSEWLWRKTMELVERVNDPHALGLTTLTVGIAYRLHGRYRQSLDNIQRGAAILRERCTGVAWELEAARIMTLVNLLWLGQWNEMFRLLPEFLQEAEARGDVYGATDMRIRILPFRLLAEDRPDRAREEARRGIERWSVQGFHLQHYHALCSQVEADLYAADGAGAWERLARAHGELTRSKLMHLENARIEFLFLRARAALTAAMRGDARMLQQAEDDAARLERTRALWAVGLVRLVRAGVAVSRGEDQAAKLLIADAEQGFEASDMALLGTVCRRRRGELMGGRAGLALVEDADAWLVGQQVLNPTRLSDLLAPGRWPHAVA